MQGVTESYRRRVEVLLEAYRALDRVREGARAVSLLNARSRMGDRMIKAGVALVVFPEPFLSDMLGSLLIGSGLLLKKRSTSPTLDDLRVQAAETLRSLGRLKEGLELK